ncbi:hypothetical protein MKEN_00857900 [Mycena kentingensis (nom. inval.)]|nr:hypothetical protein MKEN_00857900 [Mycena kentingensis (nom. inval.)]
MKHIGRSPPYSESVLNTSIRPYTTPSIISAREYYVTSSPPTSDLANEYPHFAEASPALAHRLPTSVIAYPTSAIAYPASQSSVPPRHRLSRPFLVCAAPLSSPPLRHRKNPSWRRTWARSLVISLPGMVVLLVAGSLERNERGSEPGSIGNVAVTGRGRRRSIVFSTVLDRARGGGTHPASPTSTGLRSERQNGVGNVGVLAAGLSYWRGHARRARCSAPLSLFIATETRGDASVVQDGINIGGSGERGCALGLWTDRSVGKW